MFYCHFIFQYHKYATCKNPRKLERSQFFRQNLGVDNFYKNIIVSCQMAKSLPESIPSHPAFQISFRPLRPLAVPTGYYLYVRRTYILYVCTYVFAWLKNHCHLCDSTEPICFKNVDLENGRTYLYI